MPDGEYAPFGRNQKRYMEQGTAHALKSHEYCSERNEVVLQKLDAPRTKEHRFNAVAATEHSARNKFTTLAQKWKSETGHMSSIRDISMNFSYQQIIGMGKDALPYIIEDLMTEPHHWFWALQAITGKTDVGTEGKGDISRIAMEWITVAHKEGWV